MSSNKQMLVQVFEDIVVCTHCGKSIPVANADTMYEDTVDNKKALVYFGCPDCATKVPVVKRDIESGAVLEVYIIKVPVPIPTPPVIPVPPKPHPGPYKPVVPTQIPEIKVKYHFEKYPDLLPLEKLDNGDFIDLRCAKTTVIEPKGFALIPFGISVKLPKDYWAQVVPRSSTYKKYGIIQTNSFGVIDESYCGNDDEWFMPVLNMKDEETVIQTNTRIAQFRIVSKIPFNIKTVLNLPDPNRGGFGSTGD